MARSEYRRCPPRRPLRPGVQAAIRLRGQPHRHIAAANEGLVIGRPVRNAVLRLIRGMNLRLHSRSVAPAEGPEKCGPRRPTRNGYSCNNASLRLSVFSFARPENTPEGSAKSCLLPVSLSSFRSVRPAKSSALSDVRPTLSRVNSVTVVRCVVVHLRAIGHAAEPVQDPVLHLLRAVADAGRSPAGLRARRPSPMIDL